MQRALGAPHGQDMHNNHSMKRQRGRGRKPGGGGGGHHQSHGHHQPNRTMESNGPEGKVRGPAALIYERYLQLARDASSSGDRVLAENFFQHADHYFRLLRAMQPAMPPPQERVTNESEFEADHEGAAESEASDDGRQRSEDEQVETAEPNRQPQDAGERVERDGEFRRRRGRRTRFRPGGDNEEGDTREPRENAARRGREDAREEESPAGFSTGPRPAFLRQE